MPAPPPVRLVILDLDGTLIQSETLVLDVAREVVRSHGRELTDAAVAASTGRRPLEAWQAVVDLLGIPASAEALFAQSEPLLTHRWHEAPLLPGAARLVGHLAAAGVRLALATSTSRATLARKLADKPQIMAAFEHVVCGDDAAVANGKPAPDCFLAVAAAAGVPPEECLVIEDAPCGVQAGVAAGMRVVVVPSLVRRTPCAPACASSVFLLAAASHPACGKHPAAFVSCRRRGTAPTTRAPTRPPPAAAWKPCRRCSTSAPSSTACRPSPTPSAQRG
jgi:HAD superfamily hydrolase (TIGR01509 family)